VNCSLLSNKLDEAIAAYSKAIELDPSNAAYYSNRCAAYLQTGGPSNLVLALADAESCIENKRDWAKGYARKGSVLCRQKNYKGAIKAYSIAIEHSPGGVSEEYTKAITEVRSLQASDSAFAFKKMLYHFEVIAHLAVYLLSVLYPILLAIDTSQGYFLYYSALKAVIVCQLVTLVRLFGLPKWSSEYAQKAVSSPELHFLMPALMFHGSEPMFMTLVPPILRALLALSRACVFYRVPLVGNVAAKLSELQQPISDVIAKVELGCTLLLLVLLFTPSRNFLMVILSFQYIRMRYMVSYEMKGAVHEVRVKLDSLFSHRLCPAVFGKVWGKLADWLTGMGDPSRANEGANKYCSVM
jgi:hypothetical protein